MPPELKAPGLPVVSRVRRIKTKRGDISTPSGIHARRKLGLVQINVLNLALVSTNQGKSLTNLPPKHKTPRK